MRDSASFRLQREPRGTGRFHMAQNCACIRRALWVQSVASAKKRKEIKLKIKLASLVAMIFAPVANFSSNGQYPPGMAQPAPVPERPASLCVVNGQIYDQARCQLWRVMDARILKISGSVVLVQTYTTENVQQAVVERHRSFAMGVPTGGYHDETKLVNVGTRDVDDKKIVLLNYSTTQNVAVGERVSFCAMQVGTTNYDGKQIELWDMGTKPSASDLKRLQDGYAAKQLESQKQIAEQQRVVAEKAAAKKKAGQEKLLKHYQEQAESGNAFALLRLGEFYRDGDGVPKDLTKARDYLTKATAAGSPTAADELKLLPAN
jgi:hypothetical protein